jgi:CelD/BcsL family acetyltransferase involved in cellulose biosynthesis
MPSHTALRCSVVTGPAGLERLRPAWRDLLRRSAADEPVLAPLWLLTWWQVYGQPGGRDLRVCLFHDGDRLAGLAPLQRRRCWYRPGIPLWRLELLGADVDEGDGVSSDYLNVLAERGAEAGVADALAVAVTAGAFGRWDEVVLPAMAGDGVLPALLTAAFTRAGLAARCTVTGAALHIPLPETWEDYVRRLSANDRRYLLRSLRDFDAWAGPDVQVGRVTTPAELEEGKRILARLHAERWAAAGRGGVFRKSRFAAFHDAVLPQLLAEGALELIWLQARGEPLAALYNFVWNGKVYNYQSGRKVDLPRGLRPGIVLHARAIRAAIEAGRREYDFLAGGEQYKKQLALAARPLVQVRAARPCLAEAARRLAERGVACARTLRNACRSLCRRRPR